MTKPHVYGMDLLRGVLTAHDKRHVNLSVSQIGTAVGASSDASGLMAVTGELGSYSPYCLFHQMKLQRHGETLKPGWQCPGGGELNMGGGAGRGLTLVPRAERLHHCWESLHRVWVCVCVVGEINHILLYDDYDYRKSIPNYTWWSIDCHFSNSQT